MDDKKFVKPEVEIIDFYGEDIVTVSEYDTLGWDKDGFQEEW